MSAAVPGPPTTPTIDENPDPGNAAGGTDAIEDPTPSTEETPLTRDLPASEHVDQEQIPDELQEPEGPDSEANLDDPSAEPPG
ncbi:hypothetical protein ABIE44_002689 [Marmoricola sp. OAE513]|uniref:hypothetical protein n=1 Tax=Marmoricola sp. OAE513 TaxID=2817894 RepID=UPI001AEA3E71